jgi:1-acyl-sn-glycerol-3-phosphate acyltransferase
MSAGERMTPMYRMMVGSFVPIVRLWGRLEVEGLEHIPEEGPALLAGNHDSYWDPVVVGVAALRRRQIRALAKSSLWEIRVAGILLDGMGQIPIIRGSGDVGALDRAITELRAGACIGIFPEGTRSLGRTLRPRSGLGRLAAAVPEATVVPVAIEGSTDIPRFPKRPRLRVRFLAPVEGPLEDESPAAFAARVTADVRALAPISPAGRRPKLAATPPGG